MACPICGATLTTAEVTNNRILGPGGGSWTEYYTCTGCSVMFKDKEKFYSCNLIPGEIHPESKSKMSFKEYTKTIWKLYPVNDLNWQALGLVSEAGEFGNKIKKLKYLSTIDRDALSDELGDILWHFSQCCELLNLDIDKILKSSIEKTINKNITLKERRKNE